MSGNGRKNGELHKLGIEIKGRSGQIGAPLYIAEQKLTADCWPLYPLVGDLGDHAFAQFHVHCHQDLGHQQVVADQHG